jgi:hypothetical protein
MELNSTELVVRETIVSKYPIHRLRYAVVTTESIGSHCLMLIENYKIALDFCNSFRKGKILDLKTNDIVYRGPQ